ncbi:hypothetical protein MHYP_G00170660 [Metynnis hypsauchen]
MVLELDMVLGTFKLCLLQRTLAYLRSVHPGENITLHCDITANYEISWYHQSSEEMKLKLLIIAGKGKLNKSFSLSHNVDEDHYDGTINTSSVSLVIVGVNESDLGLYYCGGRNITTSIQFGKAVRLTFGDGDLQSNGSDSEPPPDYNDNPLHWIIIIVLTSVCLVQMSIISLCGFCHRVKGERCGDLHSTEKVSEILLINTAGEVQKSCSLVFTTQELLKDPQRLLWASSLKHTHTAPVDLSLL